MKLTCDFAVPQ